jgi:hypothetical protein
MCTIEQKRHKTNKNKQINQKNNKQQTENNGILRWNLIHMYQITHNDAHERNGHIGDPTGAHTFAQHTVVAAWIKEGFVCVPLC